MSKENVLNFEDGEFLSAISGFNKSDAENASSAGENRQAIGTFLDKTGLNSKAFSHLRALSKMKKEEDQLDYLRSMERGLPILASHIRGAGTMEMDLKEPAKDVEAPAEETPEGTPAYFAGEDAFDAGVTREGNPHDDGSQESADWLEGWDAAAELGDFGEEVDSNVIPMGS